MYCEYIYLIMCTFGPILSFLSTGSSTKNSRQELLGRIILKVDVSWKLFEKLKLLKDTIISRRMPEISIEKEKILL